LMMIDDDINGIPLKVYFYSDSPGELASCSSVANMTDEEFIKLEARLGAIEVAICDLAAICYITGRWTDADIKQRHDLWSELARLSPIEGLNPAEAALVSGELEDALSALSAMIRSHMAKYLRQNPGSPQR
jgi:hypothetical protein